METIVSKNLDANESIFFARELEMKKSRSFDRKYPEFKATRLIPVSTEAGPGAEVITYESFDKVGIMKIIANYADDLPRSDIKGSEFSSPVRSLGGSYGYSVQEIRAAQLAGKPLVQRKADASRKANEQAVDNIAWKGDVNSGLRGILDNQNVSTGVVTVGATSGNLTWATKTNTEIVFDMFEIVDGILNTTLGVENPDMLLLPLAQFSLISSKRMEAGTDTTVKEFFERNRPGITIDWVNVMKDVTPSPATGGTKDVMVAYKRSPDNLTLEIPQPYEQFPVQERNLEFVVPTHSRIGGVIIYYPLSVSLIEGI